MIKRKEGYGDRGREDIARETKRKKERKKESRKRGKDKANTYHNHL